ncbi:hypothetical protein BDF20DRAFT_899602, partial [Mycotypha africana]|uniref:uncharacterized protein n=1 Tax=Mycotypha africana TaxID=64632 RepID=UPI0023001DB7
MNQLEKFHQVFSFKTMGFKSLNDLKTSQETLFRSIVRSDGFTIDFLFTGYRPYFIDHGRKDVFKAAIGLNVEKHQLRRCSTT